MSVTPLQRLLLAAFPTSFRARYGDELAALVPACGTGWHVTADLARAVARAWLRPTFAGAPDERRRLRLQATTSTVLLMWALSAFAAAAFGRAVDDKPVPGLHAWGLAAYTAGSGVFQVGAAVVLATGFIYWALVVGKAWQRSDRGILIPAVLPVPVAIVWLGVTAVIAVVGRLVTPGNARHLAAQGPATAGGMAVLAVYALFTLACVVICAACVIRALERARLSDRLLAGSTWVAAAVTLALAATAVAASVCLTRVLMVGGTGARDTAVAVGAALVLAVACAGALTSTVRGMRAVAVR